ncbi:MAG TPA: AsmA family protein [Acetobacteraceae bacterium]|nr:AsmA family protein [Acetobacteraceae bacterium]
MKRLAGAVAVLFLLVVAGLWLGPRLMDWEPWRDRLAELASDRLGRPVSLSGPVQVLLLPQPTVLAGGVSIGEAGEGFSVTAQRLRLRVAFAALLAGRIQPREVTLVRPELTLPWPPGPVLALRPPSWVEALDARVEDGRIRIGEVVLEGVTGALTTGGPAQTFQAEGGFAVAGRAGGFAAVLGRPGWDGISTLELSFTLPEMSGSVRGVLIPDAGFEGQVELRGPDLAALLAAPAGPFRASGRLSASAELVAADDLRIDLAQSPARGAIALRLAPAARLEVALQASRLDLDGWVRALRQAPRRPWPVSVDLSAEVASFGGVTLRRLRGAAFLEDGRLTLSDVHMLLPGETELDLAGATAGARLEVAARFAGADVGAALAAFGLPLDGVDPTLLRRGEGRMRLVLEEAQASVPDFAATFEELRVSGAGVLRHGARPSLGFGLTVNRLDLDRWLRGGIGLTELGRVAAAFDLNLRLAADEVRTGGTVLERAALDAALEGGRLTLRRLSGRLAGADLSATGALALGPQPRLQELVVEARGPNAAGLSALLPGAWPDGTPLARLPLIVRLQASGAPDALQWRGSGEMGELRAEGTGTLDALARRGTAAVTLRHPGAPRLLSEGFGLSAGPWLGEGSFSLVAALALSPDAVSAESFELVAGELRARGALALARAGAAQGQHRPRLSGRVQAERLPLPFPGWRADAPLGLDMLRQVDAEVALQAASLDIAGSTAEGVATTLRLLDGRLRLEGLRARVSGGTLQGGAELLAAADAAPRLSAQVQLTDAVLSERVFGLPFDIAAGRGDLRLDLSARGHSMSALLGSLSGDASVALRDGIVTGLDLTAALSGTALTELAAADALIRRSLRGGATAFERLEAAARLAGGRAVLTGGRLVAEGGAAAAISGEADLARGTLDLLISLQPGASGAPEIALRVSGPADQPRPLPDTAAWLRWRAERG